LSQNIFEVSILAINCSEIEALMCCGFVRTDPRVGVTIPTLAHLIQLAEQRLPEEVCGPLGVWDLEEKDHPLSDQIPYPPGLYGKVSKHQGW